MGGTDDDAVRQLSATLERFRGDAREALGVTADADAATARRAFMELCKRYHPAKFARYAPATVRLANEVFLAIKRAYEGLSAPETTSPTLVPGSQRATVTLGPPHAGRPPPTGPGSTRLAPPPAALRTTPTPRPMSPTAPLGSPRPAAPAPPTRPMTPTSTPPPSRPTVKAPAATRPPASTPRPPPPPPTPPPTPPPPGPPVVQRPTGRATKAEIAGTVKARERFETALEHVRKQRYGDARTIFAELAAEAPTDTRYRAYLHYVRGWEAFQLGKDGEARAEWQRALVCDPGLGLAKWALESTGMAR